MSEHWFYMLRNLYTMENKQENYKYTSWVWRQILRRIMSKWHVWISNKELAEITEISDKKVEIEQEVAFGI